MALLVMLIAAVWPATAPAQLSLQIKVKEGTRLGNAFFVRNDGLLATSFALVEDASKVRLVLSEEETFDVAGVVAASRAHDVAILIIKKLPKGLAKEQIGFAQRPEFSPGDKLYPRFGPLQQPPQDQLTTPGATLPPPTVARLMDATTLRFGYEKRTAATPGQADEIAWVVLDRGFDASAAGAPLWDAKFNRIQGMLTSLMGTDQRTRLVLPIEHVVRLIPAGNKPKFLPLSDLRRWQDEWLPISPDDAQTVTKAAQQRSLSERLESCQAQWRIAEQAVGPAQQVVLKVESIIPPLLSKVGEQREKIAIIQNSPEERYFVRMVKDQDQKVQFQFNTDYETIVDPRFSKPTVVARLRLSKRQLEAVAALWREIADDFRTLVDRQLELQYAKEFSLPNARRSEVRARDGLFLLADPCEFRSEDEHRELLAQLDEIIEQRGALAEFYLARGLCKLRLRQLAESEADFAEAAELDVNLAPLANLAEARRRLLMNDEKGRQEWQKKALVGQGDPKKRNGKLSFLLARMELDLGNTIAATHHLENALAAGLDPLDVHLALAWVHAAPPNGKDANARQALVHAKAASALAGSMDWLSLAALAAAHARQKDFREADKALTRATQLAPPEFVEQFAEWRSDIDAKKPLTRDWQQRVELP